jgi:hypothetical protein
MLILASKKNHQWLGLTENCSQSYKGRYDIGGDHLGTIDECRPVSPFDPKKPKPRSCCSSSSSPTSKAFTFSAMTKNNPVF